MNISGDRPRFDEPLVHDEAVSDELVKRAVVLMNDRMRRDRGDDGVGVVVDHEDVRARRNGVAAIIRVGLEVTVRRLRDGTHQDEEKECHKGEQLFHSGVSNEVVAILGVRIVEAESVLGVKSATIKNRRFHCEIPFHWKTSLNQTFFSEVRRDNKPRQSSLKKKPNVKTF